MCVYACTKEERYQYKSHEPTDPVDHESTHAHIKKSKIHTHLDHRLARLVVGRDALPDALELLQGHDAAVAAVTAAAV